MATSSFLGPLHKPWVSALLLASALTFPGAAVLAPCSDAQSAKAEQNAPPPQEAQPQTPQSPDTQNAQPEAPISNPASTYDRTIFQKPIPADQLTFLNRFAGSTSNDLIRDKQYRKLMKLVIPNCIFHYGWDIMLADALEKVLSGSNLPVQIQDGRYLMVSGRSGPYLGGRGFMWIDMKDGLALGGFYFHPTNGEPTPTVTIFSSQVREASLRLSQLPPAFAEDLRQWTAESNVPAVTTRYFITGSNQKILLEHDEDYCARLRRTTGPNDDCEQMNADAADMDLNAAYYLDQTNHATNATAWMIVGADQTAWIQVRDDTCRARPDRLRCRIRLTRDRIHVIVNALPSPQHK